MELSIFDCPESVVDAIRLTITEYMPRFTSPKALTLAQEREKDLLGYIKRVEETNKDNKDL